MTSRQFQKYITSWYHNNGRHHLPWRKTKHPYRILVSEIMLQQTQVPRVIPKYREFLRSFPTLHSLARAKTTQLLRAWQGLGYNRRALHLRDTARKIISNHNGKFPRDIKILESLPGIGPYTARAIAVFSWNTPEIFIETNIRRTYIHHFFKHRSTIHDHDITPFLKKTLYKKNPRLWYSALMDYGAMLGEKLRTTHIKNPNKKSAQYSRQTQFKGSQRFARSHMLRYILCNNKATTRDILHMMSDNTHLKPWIPQAQTILKILHREGFIKRQGIYWKITS